ncbi:MAG: hypothetical protein CL608_21225 [Anaerolineaceae bacterium]|nr:hypothetical protein [Anaerolineaceae bacterium]
MIKNSKKLIWATACFLFIVCACASADQLTSVDAAQSCGLDLAIVASDHANLRPGDVLKLRANKISADLEYIWSTVPTQFTENFSEKQVNKISFIVPEFDGLLKINLQAEIRGVCTERDDFEIELAPAANTELVNEDTAVESAATHTPSPTLTATPTASPEPTNTPTVAPSPTTEPTATATNTPQPTSPPLPTSTPIMAPVITRLEIISTDTLVIEWAWNGTLEADQHFAVRLWRVDNPDPTAHNSLTWLKETAYQLKINNAEFPAGEYVLNVAVVDGPSFDHHVTVVQTENHRINLPNIEPPAPPPCPPVCTEP